MELIRRALFDRLVSIPVHEIPTDFDQPFVDKLIDSFFEEVNLSALDEIAKFLEDSKPDRPEFLWAIYLRIAHRTLKQKLEYKEPKEWETKICEFLKKHDSSFGSLQCDARLSSSPCTILQQLRLELFLLMQQNGIYIETLPFEVIHLLTQESTNIFIRPITGQLAITLIRNEISKIDRSEILSTLVENLLTSDYSIVENNISDVIVYFVENLSDEQKMAILKKLQEKSRAGLAFCKLTAKIIDSAFDFSWMKFELNCRATRIMVLQEIIVLGHSNLMEDLFNFYEDSELGQLFLYLETLPTEKLDANFLKGLIDRAMKFLQVSQKPFTNSAFLAMFKIMELCGFGPNDYIQVFNALKKWIQTNPQILGFPPVSMHEKIFSDLELYSFLAQLISTGIYALDWETRDSSIEILSIVGTHGQIATDELLNRLLELAKTDECSYVRMDSLKYLVKKHPEELLKNVAELYQLNLDSDFRACLLDFLQNSNQDWSKSQDSLITIVQESLDHEDDPGVLEKVSTLCENFLSSKEASNKLRSLHLLLHSEIAIGHHERNQRKENLEDIRLQVEDMIETMEKTCQTGVDDCIIKECY
uniref:Uncharacterized protein n=1 Tax=Acrobeloides nanus TaxID=290746 RepID=A0A914BY47_9BILA